MKKLVLMFVAIAAISFASCNNNKPAENADSTAVDTALVDSAAQDSAVADSAEVAEVADSTSAE